MASAALEKAFPTLFKDKKGKKGKKGKTANDANPVEANATVEEARKGYKPTTPKLPQVDLLPPHLLIQVKRRATRFTFFVIALVMVIVSGMVFALGKLQMEAARQSIAAAETQVAATQQQLALYGEVQAYVAAVAQRKATVDSIVTNNLPYENILTTLDNALPAGAAYTSVGIQPFVGDASNQETVKTFLTQCGTLTDPFATSFPPVSACINIAGTANSEAEVQELANRLKRNKDLVNVNITPAEIPATAEGPATTSFLGSFAMRKGN